jgi:site-specific DNA recombinase
MSHIAPPTTLVPGSIIDAYVRDSGGPRQDASTDQQVSEIQAYCNTYGLVLRKTYADVARSGKTTAGREEFTNMLDSTTRPEDRPKGLILWNYARFARELDDSTYFKSLLRKRNIIIHSLTDNIPEGPYGRVVEFFIDISNEEKRRQTSKDAKRGLRELVQKHRCVPGVAPLGFLREPVDLGVHRDGSKHIAHRWIPDPEMLGRIRSAFEMRASGSTLRQIHQTLGIYGALNSYKTFFSNKIYIGILEFGDLVIEDYCEPFVSMEIWNAVQERIHHYAELRLTSMHPRRVHSPYVLSGLVYCAECGSPMFGNTTTRSHIQGRDEAYRCSRARRRLDCNASRIPRRVFEESVLATLVDYVLSPESLGLLYDIEQRAVDHRETKRAARLEIINAEKGKIAKQIVNITRAIAERGHSATLLDKLTELESQLSQLRLELSELTAMRFDHRAPLTPIEVEFASKLLVEQIQSGDPEIPRQMLRSFISRIEVKREDGRVVGLIHYFAPISPPFVNPPGDGAGYNSLPLGPDTVGAPLYRQLFTHPIVVLDQKSHSK